jgi:dihydroflavonol-4-reductase
MILVTGASGHIGNVLVRLLHERGHEDLRLLVHKSDVPYLKPYAKEIVRGDICDAAAVLDAVKGCSDVFHLAGMIQVASGYKTELGEVNALGTRNVLDACLRHGVSRVVYASSVEALKTQGCCTIDETLELNPRAMVSDYSCSKMMGTVEAFNAFQKGLDVVIVYPTAVIGPYDYRGSMAGDMIRKCIGLKMPVPCFTGGFDFVDVRDVADGIYRAWKYGEKGQGYILAGSYALIGDIIKSVRECALCPAKLVTFPLALVRLGMGLLSVWGRLTRRPNVLGPQMIDLLCMDARVSGEKAQKQLGYRPRPLEETLRDIVAWDKGCADLPLEREGMDTAEQPQAVG